MNRVSQFLISCTFAFSCAVHAHDFHVWDFSVNGQVYPAGFISTLGVKKNVGLKSMLGLRVGHNLVRHGNLGVQDNERGQGFGGSLDYTYYLNQDLDHWYATLRSDVWFNSVDWKNNIGQSNETSGNTNIIVVQPTIEVGYACINKKNFFVRPNIAFGAEINVDTQGEEVGQGLIGLLGVSIGWRKK